MKELIAYTLEQRLALYHHIKTRLLGDIERGQDYGCGFCWMIELAVRNYFGGEEDENYLWRPLLADEDNEGTSYFPELIKHKPEESVFSSGESGGHFWFDTMTNSGGAKRLEIIEKVIEEVKTKIANLSNSA